MMRVSLKTVAYELTATKKCKKHLHDSEYFTLYRSAQTDFDRVGFLSTQRRGGAECAGASFSFSRLYPPRQLPSGFILPGRRVTTDSGPFLSPRRKARKEFYFFFLCQQAKTNTVSPALPARLKTLIVLAEAQNAQVFLFKEHQKHLASFAPWREIRSTQ